MMGMGPRASRAAASFRLVAGGPEIPGDGRECGHGEMCGVYQTVGYTLSWAHTCMYDTKQA